MTSAVDSSLVEELHILKQKVAVLDQEMHALRQEYNDSHLTSEEQFDLAEALVAEKTGKAVSLSELKKRLG